MKILPVEAQSFFADGRIGGQTMITLIVAFRNFVDTPKNG
jgi:hypothetical protein